MSLFLKLVCSLEDPTLDTSDIFMVHVSRKSYLDEGLECGCLSHATIALPALGDIVMGCINLCLETKGRRGCGVKPVLGIGLVEAKR